MSVWYRQYGRSRASKHPVLSDDMIVTQATAPNELGVHSVRADFEQPRRLFCSASGRVWDPPGR